MPAVSLLSSYYEPRIIEYMNHQRDLFMDLQMTHFLCIREKRPSFFFGSATSFFFFPLLCFGCGARVAELFVDSAVDALELAADLSVLVVELA